MYQKKIYTEEANQHDLTSGERPIDGNNNKGFGGDISSICIAPFDDEQIKAGQFTDFIGDDSV